MNKHYFIIGDVHGCLKTFQELVHRYWNKDKEILIQLGDLIDRGAYSPQTIQYCMDLEVTYPGLTLFLKGNHEQMLLDYYDNIASSWWNNGGRETIIQFESANLDIKDYLPWIRKNRLLYENRNIFVSHAGWSHNAKGIPDDRHPNGLLWNRSKLKNLGKLQVIGHTPLTSGIPSYNPESNSLNIDTGAYKGICLSGIKIDVNGKILQHCSVPSMIEDLIESN
ncbi:metallophosphoesterase family protein [Anditalea andensis]|uniref:Serine/threonine specific protein phosphatases domain-containing protein n=1 Tax=Anditalea andensis TaxID=1048983 RepID=A0A074KV70_9BACT|nr:metallophosphoesterase family protein [Anditalea andensis]KEO72824.1 hypothetical protein EL17_14445 [Anditalea andensis]